MQTAYLETLTKFIVNTYGLPIQSITSAKRGFFGETWKARTSTADYFVKIDYTESHREIYRKSFPIVDFITKSGIDWTLHIVPTKSGALCCTFGLGVMGIFLFCEGENREDYPVESLFRQLAPIYQLDIGTLSIDKENFSADVLATLISLVQNAAAASENSSEQVIRFIQSKSELLERYAQRLGLFARRCQGNLRGFCITHGDAGGNCIISDDLFQIVDWDSPKFAPIERDAWFFMCDDQAIAVINSVLRKQGIDYILDDNRICYYCYDSFFYYLVEHLQTCFNAQQGEKKQIAFDQLKDYFESWIFMQLNKADQIN